MGSDHRTIPAGVNQFVDLRRVIGPFHSGIGRCRKHVMSQPWLRISRNQNAAASGAWNSSPPPASSWQLKRSLAGRILTGPAALTAAQKICDPLPPKKWRTGSGRSVPVAAVKNALDWVRTGDVLVLPVHPIGAPCDSGSAGGSCRYLNVESFRLSSSRCCEKSTIEENAGAARESARMAALSAAFTLSSPSALGVR